MISRCRKAAKKDSPHTGQTICSSSAPGLRGTHPEQDAPICPGTHFEGNGALAVPVAVFETINFDNGLIELRNELEAHGFHTIAGAGIPTEHVFQRQAGNRTSDADDLAQIHAFRHQSS